MQVLVKITVTLSQPTDRDSVNTILRRHGFMPVWDIVLGNVRAIMLFSMNTKLYVDKYSNAFFDILGTDGETLKPLIDIIDIDTIPLDFNCPSTVTQTTNGNITTTVSQQSYTDGVGTWTYTTTGTFNASNGVNSISSVATYTDEKVTQTTVMNVDPETGEGVITTTSTNNETGQVTEHSNYYDENGELTNTHIEETNTDNSHKSTDIVYNGDGSSVSHTTDYDQNDNPVSGQNQWNDTSGNQNTQSLEYDSNGDPEVVGYEIDTSGNTQGTGEQIEAAVDTGFIAFNGKSFIITADIELNMDEQGTSPYKTLLSALELIEGTTKYKGFYIRNRLSTYTIAMFGANRDGINLSETTGEGGYALCGGSSISLKHNAGRVRYHLEMTYTPGSSGTSGNVKFTIGPNTSNSSSTISDQSSSLPPTMDNAKIILGGNGIYTNLNVVNLTIYSFNVQKTS